MKAFLMDVYHHGKVKFKLVQFNFLTLLIFEALYTLVGTEIIYPGSFFLFDQVMHQLGFAFISDANISQVLTNPLCLLTILVLLLILGFYGLFELTTLIVLFNESHFKRNVGLIPLCQKSFERALHIVKPRNFPLIIFVLIIIPFTKFSLASSFVSEVSIPDYLMAHIFASPMLTLAYYAVIIVLFLMVLFGIFSLHYFTLADNDFLAAIKKSRSLINGHFWHTTFWVAFWNGAILLTLLLLFSLFEVFAYFVLGQLLENTLALSVFIGGFGFFVSALFTTFHLIETAITFALVSMFYYDYSERAHLEVPSTALIQTKKPFIARKKSFISLSIVAILVIVAHSSTIIFNNFNETFNAHFIAGPQIIAQSSPSTPTTLITLQQAIDDGADGAELNVAQTKDGVLVVAAPTIKSTAGETITIGAATVDELTSLGVITLSDALLFSKDKLKLNLQLDPTEDDANLVAAVIAAIHQTNSRDQCLLASMDYPTLEQVAVVDPQLKRVYVTSVAMGKIQTLPVDALSIEASFISPGMVTAIHGEYKEIFAWTVNSEKSLTEMVHFGVDNIITNDVSQAKKVVAHLTEPRELIDQINDFLFKDIVLE
ncbi:hypothetical protein GH810_09905 [Acetobacterium paludosum]|uniref:GP-PDE domain-containing protein n=1 Tax=Acetobacterium paludosum TaxID=52693 RepID=A0A923KSQ5_9FIRM|nr:glycerophosphoryl diester phosphodiesterase membrane domain-containing protein [Acetobacterium paludosum]MBC3888622.1 hypothetical protein [Acetobacterium paludosum]